MASGHLSSNASIVVKDGLWRRRAANGAGWDYPPEKLAKRFGRNHSYYVKVMAISKLPRPYDV
ncbi:MAG: hypothetical protein ACE5OY_06895 [Candidatus Bathyarchaeia archaeon]